MEITGNIGEHFPGKVTLFEIRISPEKSSDLWNLCPYPYSVQKQLSYEGTRIDIPLVRFLILQILYTFENETESESLA